MVYKNNILYYIIVYMSNAPAPHFDLSSNLNLQKNYLLDLSKIPIDPVTNKESENAISSLNKQMNTTQSTYALSNSASGDLLNSQKTVNTILTTENDRLQMKKQNIDAAVSGQRRIVFLNINYQKRYEVYTKMAIALVIGLVIYFIIQRFREAFPIIPDVIYMFLIMLDFATVIVVILVYYYQLTSRDLMNYDEISLTPPDMSLSNAPVTSMSTTPGATGAPGTNTASSSTPTCVGKDCCGTDNYGNAIPYTPAAGCSLANSDDMIITDISSLFGGSSSST